MTEPQVRLVTVTAGLSQPSSTRLLANRLTAATTDHVERRGLEVQSEIVELRVWARQLAENVVTGFATTDLAAVKTRLSHADAVIAVTPIFNARVVPTAVYAATEDWASDGDLTRRIDRAAGELASLAGHQLPTIRRRRAGVDSRASDPSRGEAVPFERLLAAQRAAAGQQL